MDKILLFLRPQHKRVVLSFLTMIVALLTTNCVTHNPPLAELRRFDLTKEEVSTSEFDRIYDSSRLKVGNSAVVGGKITISYEARPRSYVTTKEVIAIDDSTRNYIVDILTIPQEGDGQLTTIEVDPLYIRRVLDVSGYKVLNVSKIKSDQLDPIIRAALKDWWAKGVPGIMASASLELLKKHRSEAVLKRYSQARKDYKDQYKIIKFDQISDEEVTVGARRIFCKVYQIDVIRKEMTVSSDRSEPFYKVVDTSTKIWVSDDVPFGVVKVDSKSIYHSGAEEMGVKKKPMEATIKEELIDFKD